LVSELIFIAGLPYPRVDSRGVCKSEKLTSFGLRVILRLFSPDSLISRRDSFPIETIFGEQEPVTINNDRMREVIIVPWRLFRFMMIRVYSSGFRVIPVPCHKVKKEGISNEMPPAIL